MLDVEIFSLPLPWWPADPRGLYHFELDLRSFHRDAEAFTLNLGEVFEHVITVSRRGKTKPKPLVSLSPQDITDLLASNWWGKNIYQGSE